MALRVGVDDLRGADALDPVQNRGVPTGGIPKIGPVVPLAAGDDVINGGESEATVIQVAVTHISLSSGIRRPLGPGLVPVGRRESSVSL